MADNKKQEELRQMTDPIAYRDNPQSGYDKYIEGWDASKLQNADVNLSQYGDDSSAANYNNQSLWGGENQKYTGENTLGSQVAYNPNATLEGLNPDYKYGQAAQMANSQNANYIASRNDEIASALYNAGKTSIQDVNDFLSTQTGWDYSNANERANTVASVWKRIGQIAQQQGPKDQPKPERETIKGEKSDGKIYGKATADSGEPIEGIDTLTDANNIYNSLIASRQANLDTLYNMSTDVIAASIVTDSFTLGEQALIDYQRAYPQLRAEVQRKEKELRGQMAVEAIAKGETNNSSVIDTTNTSSDVINYATSNSSLAVSSTSLLKSIDSILESNDTAKSAQELMGSIENDLAKLKNRMQNLKQEANTVFKGDAPDYLVRAYMNNKTQEIQNQMSILEDRYNAAYNRYKTELAHAEWEAELDLKKQSLSLEEYKAKNSIGVTTSSTNKNYTVAERNNNPTNMTVDFLKMMGAVAGVDYEVSEDYFINGNNKRQYYGKLIGDPIERTISILDNAVAKGMNPFTVTSRSYINKLGLTKDKWNSMSHEEKVEMIKKWLPYEGGSMENMDYYLKQKGIMDDYNENHAPYYQKFIDADYTSTKWPETIAAELGYGSVADFRDAAYAWKDAQAKKIEEESKVKPAYWTRKDGTQYSLADTPTYDTLTYDQKNIVQQLLNLNKNPATVTKRQYGDAFEQILSAVKEINPSWSDADYGQADKVEKEWNTSSKNGSNSRNGTAIATAMDIYNIADEFGNVKWKDWNGMLNKLKDKLSDEAYTQLLINLEVLASEYAGALKGSNAAPTEQEINDKKEIIAANLGAGAMKQASIDIAKTLYNKNANEAYNYQLVTLHKAPLVVTPDVADWMYNVAGITTLPQYYDYKPTGYVDESEINDLELDEAINNAGSVGDLLNQN